MSVPGCLEGTQEMLDKIKMMWYKKVEEQMVYHLENMFPATYLEVIRENGETNRQHLYKVYIFWCPKSSWKSH